jgi:hypothetical protein
MHFGSWIWIGQQNSIGSDVHCRGARRKSTVRLTLHSHHHFKKKLKEEISAMAKSKGSSKANSQNNTPNKSQEFEIPASEQLRIIQQSGLLQRIPRKDANGKPLIDLSEDDIKLLDVKNTKQEEEEEEEEEVPSLGENIFETILWVIPFSCLFVGL